MGVINGSWLSNLVVLVLTAIMFYIGFQTGQKDGNVMRSRGRTVPCPLPVATSQMLAEQLEEPCDEFMNLQAEKSWEKTPSAPRKAPQTHPECATLHGRLPKISILPFAHETPDPAQPNYDPHHGSRVGNMKGTGTGGRTVILSPAATDGHRSVLSAKDIHQCTTIAQTYAHNCFGVAFAKFDASTVKPGSPPAGLPVVRFDEGVDEAGLVIDGTNDNVAERAGSGTLEDRQSKGIGSWTLNGNTTRPAGHFRRVPKERGFQRILEKMGPFLKNFKGIKKTLVDKLNTRGIKKGDDVVVMVVNEGETDLFLNFACSCKLHGIDMRNVLVFSGSKEVEYMIEASDAMSVYHSAFADVSKKASTDYLDRVFVDMMWYKAFSTYLVLHVGINILFQDVDLVWWRDPFPYFKQFSANETRQVEEGNSLKGKPVEAFFSDDGQRSKRYSPYFFNSGFYYLKSTPRSQYFTWSIMTAFDAVQVTGSHQNVFTLRLVESLGLGAAYTQMLPLFEFPNGILYHHNKKFMKSLAEKKEDPYHFHMCWTQGKPQKLDYLRKASMWYLSEKCSALPDLIHPKGKMYVKIKKKDAGSKRTVADWLDPHVRETEASAFMRNQCCVGTGLNRRELKKEL